MQKDVPPDPDVFRVTLSASDRTALAKVIREFGLDVDHQHPGKEHTETQAFLTQAQIDKLQRGGWDIRVHENLSEVGRARQKEVAKGDRFEGGKIRPQGLGKKVREGK